MKNHLNKFIKAKPRAIRRTVILRELGKISVISGWCALLNGEVVNLRSTMWNTRKEALQDARDFREECRKKAGTGIHTARCTINHSFTITRKHFLVNPLVHYE
jgi:hypothetical protein